jgi:hypothetical protein
MTVEELKEIVNRDNDEYLKFEDIPAARRFSNRADLNAFILLDKLLPADPDGRDIISAAEHDEFWLSPSLEEVAPLISEEQAIDLVRCGVRLDDYGHGFCFFA